MKDNRIALMGAICGDIVGSAYEWRRTKRLDFEMLPRGSRFTDDTVMTIAVADWLMSGDSESRGSVAPFLQKWGRKYPRAGYGGMFRKWLVDENPQPYNSFGNGSAMRVSPCGWYATTVEEALKLAKESAEATHNHPDGIMGAQVVAKAIFMARQGKTKEEIAMDLHKNYPKYDILRQSAAIRETYRFNSTCHGSVPESVISFLESEDYESAVRIAVSLGGDADTMGAIAGSMAAAFYKEIPNEIADPCLEMLPRDIRDVIEKFSDLGVSPIA